MERNVGLQYGITGMVKNCIRDRTLLCKNIFLKNNFKLVYEVKFGCSLSLFKLKKIYEFYKNLKSIREDFLFCIVSPVNSDSFVKFYLDETLENYDVCVIYQKPKSLGTDLFLLDDENKIIMAGDIWEYPFLKKIYLRKNSNTKRIFSLTVSDFFLKILPWGYP